MPQFFHITKTGSSILITYIIFYQFVNCNLDVYYALRKGTVLDFEIEKVQGLTLITTSHFFPIYSVTFSKKNVKQISYFTFVTGGKLGGEGGNLHFTKKNLDLFYDIKKCVNNLSEEQCR